MKMELIQPFINAADAVLSQGLQGFCDHPGWQRLERFRLRQAQPCRWVLSSRRQLRIDGRVVQTFGQPTVSSAKTADVGVGQEPIQPSPQVGALGK